MSGVPHIPVLKEEVLTLFAPLGQGVVVDCTAGYGGHAEAILERFEAVHYIGIDQDTTAIEFCTRRLEPFGKRARLIYGSFSSVVPTLSDEPVVALLADLGVSSLQLDHKDRGFGFDAPLLDMRMDKSGTLSAADVVNGYSESDLVRILRAYGEEPQAAKMASLIVQNRPFTSAHELSSLIASRFKKGRIHPATLLFQAIRIEVNDELGEVVRLLDGLEQIAQAGLKVGIISFHSLEDRLVKERFRLWSRECICPPQSWRCECGGGHARGRALSKKPITASKEEIWANPRSRSAKLRGFEFKRRSDV